MTKSASPEEQKLTPHEALVLAVAIMKTQDKLAKAVDVKQPTISKLLSRKNGSSPGLATPISVAVGGKVTPQQLCPRAFPKGYDRLVSA